MTPDEISNWIGEMNQGPPSPPEGGCHNCSDNPQYICCSETWCYTHYYVHKNHVDATILPDGSRKQHVDLYVMSRPAEPEPRGGESIPIEYIPDVE